MAQYLQSGSALNSSIVSSANSLRDNPALGTDGGTINLTNAIARAGSISANNTTYGKKLTLNVTDRNASGGNASKTNATYYAGVSTVSIGGATTGVSYGSQVTASFTYSAAGGGTGNGYVEWTATSTRDTGVLTLYFSANTASALTLTLSDSGGSNVSFSVNVGGIKTAGNDIGGTSVTHNNAGWIVTSVDDGTWAWVYNEVLSNILFSDAGTASDPLVWYYTVDKADSATSFPSVTQPGGNVSTWYPFAYSTGTFNTTYDFGKGIMGGQYTQADNTNGPTGAGYYRFTFYAMNYAGYQSTNTVTVYMKVDYTAPENTVDLSYDYQGGTKVPEGDLNKDGIIDPTETVYVGTSIKAEISFVPNISGNRVLILGADGNNYVVYISAEGAITNVTSATDGSATASGWSSAEGVWTMSGGTAVDYVNVSTESVADGKIKLVAEYFGKTGVDFVKNHTFTVKNNAQATGAFTNNAGTNGGVEAADTTNWASGVPIYFDMTAPVAPDMSQSGTTSADDHLKLNSDGTVPSGSDRDWYTDDWTMTVDTSVGNDDSYIRVYYLQAYYASKEAFAADYAQKVKAFAQANASTVGGLLTSTLDVLEGSVDPYELVFQQDGVNAAGYYAVYTAGLDHAGNISGLAVYGVLVDANDYNIGANIAAESIAHFGAGNNPWTFTFVNADGVEDTYKRGETAYFSATLAGAGAYVPYEIKKYGADGSVIDNAIYTHPSDELGTAFVAGGVNNAYVSVDNNGRLAIAIDRDAIGALPAVDGGAKISFSYRRVVTADFANNQADYIGARIDFPVNLYAYNVDGSNGATITVDEANLPYSVSYPEGYFDADGVTHAGVYEVGIVGRASDYYVLKESVVKSVTVNKASLTVQIQVNDDGALYGAVTAENLKDYFAYVSAEGLKGADEGKTFDTLAGATASYVIGGIVTGYIPAGTYDAIAATLSATDYTVGFEWGADNVFEFVIAARALTVTAEGGVELTYSDALPDAYTVKLPKSAFDFDTAALYGTADKIAAIFGVDASSVTDGGDNWVVTLAADSIATDAAVNTSGYVNVGTYNFTAIEQDAIEIDSNFTVALAAEGNGQIVVSPVTVTVTPATGQEFTADDESAIAGLQVRFNDTPAEIAKFGITGYLLVGDVTATGENTYYVSDNAANLASSHNTDGVTNVIIKVAPSDVTVTIILRADLSGTFTVTFNGNIVFSTEFGTAWNKDALKDSANYTVAFTGKDGAAEPAYDFAITEVNVSNYSDNVLLNGVQKSYTVTFVYSLTVYTDESKTEQSEGQFEVVFMNSEGVDITNGTRLTVTPKTVSVAQATLANNTKVYGSAEAALNFTYKFNGLPEGYAVPSVSGIVRYGENNGTAARYDDVGTYLINYEGATIADPNLQLDKASLGEVFDGETFTITARALDLNNAILTGANKYYDGTSKANGSINIGALLVNNDVVNVTFDAMYWFEGAEVAEFGNNYAVRFYNLALAGTDAHNYTISEGITELITDYIYRIMQEIIAVNKEHFIVSKTYDGTAAVTQDYISVSDASKLSGTRFEFVSGSFHVSDAGTVAIDELVVYFPDLAWIGEGAVVEDYYNLGIDVSVSAYGTGTAFTIGNLSAYIYPRNVSVDDIVFNFAMSREYDGLTTIDVTFDVTAEFAATVAGFRVSDLGLSFLAVTSGKDVGNYIVDFLGVDMTSNNYSLDISMTADGYAALESKVNGDITADGEGAPYSIVKKTLTLEIDIPDKVYDGESNITASGITPTVSGLVGDENITVGADSYVYSDANGVADAYVQGSADTGYLHYVTVSNFSITPVAGTGFDWMNYTFSSSSVDLTGMPESGSAPYTIASYIMADAAVLAPRSIQVTLNDIKVNDKVYDGTTSATLDLSMITERNIVAGDLAAFDGGKVVYTYNAAFNTNYANVGTYNVNVSNLGIAVGIPAEDAEYALAEKIARSYVIAWTGSTSSLTAKITPAPLLVEFTLPEKTYDGTVYANIDETSLSVGEGITLKGFVAAEAYASNYNVVVYGAGYSYDDIDVNTERVNSGFVYGFALTNRTGKVNYELVFGSNSELSGFTKVTELGGLASLTDGYANYYLFNKNAYYIVDANELKTLETTELFETKLEILAEFVYNRETVYVLGVKDNQSLTSEETAALADTYGAISQELRRADAVGSIAPVSLTFTVNVTDGSAFTKPFDDTTMISGPVYGSPSDVEAGNEYDFTVTLTDSTGGTLPYLGYQITQSDITINFADANVGVNKTVIFAIKSIGGGSTGNYSFNTDDNSYTTRVVGASVTAATMPITVQLKDENGEADLTGTYGGSIEHQIVYTFNGKNVVVAQDAADGNYYAYILASEWNEAFGRAGDSLVGLDYVADRLYTQGTDGTFALDAAGTWVRLNGTFSEAIPVTESGAAIFAEDFTLAVGAGVYNNSYVRVTANNFNVNASSATVTVNKATLNITVAGNYAEGDYDFVADYYVGTLPAPVFGVLSGLASIDSESAVIAQLAYGYTLDGKAIDIRTADISDSLAEGKDYQLSVDASALVNYDVHVVDATGVDKVYKLYIKLPAFDATRYSVNTSLTKPYQSGQAVTADMIVNGLDASDVAVVNWTGLDSAPVNAGEYTWSVSITRKIDDGTNQRGYFYAGEPYTASGNYVIAQRSVIVTNKVNLGFTYDGASHQIDTANLSATDALTRENVEGFFNDVDVSYVLNGESVDSMLNAGGYTVVIVVGGAFEGNYTIDNRIGSVRVAQAPVIVSVDAASKTHDVTDGSDGCEITFTAQGVDTDHFTVTYRNSNGAVVSAITSAGVYTYTITSNDPNYYVSGGGTGNITATINRVSYTVDDVDLVTIDFGDKPVSVNYNVVDSFVSENTSYWSIVDSNVQELAKEDEVLSTGGIVKVEMSNGSSYVSSLGRDVSVTVLMPEGLTEGYRVYYVTSNGGLNELTDYTVSGDYITYTTSYISNLVFVNVSSPGLAWWIWPLIAALAVLVIAIAILVGVLVKLHRAPDPVPVEVTPIDSIMPEPVEQPAEVAEPEAVMPAAAADVEPVNYDAPAAVSKHRQPPVIGIR